MYVPDDRDLLIELTELPPASAGDSMPLVLANDRAALLAYALHEKAPDASRICITEKLLAG